MSPSIRRMAEENRRYRAVNPWRIVNMASIGTACGRYPTQEAAVEAAKSYGAYTVDVAAREVLVSRMPCL